MLEQLKDWFIKWLIEEDVGPSFPMSDFERIRYELRPCDIILVEGRSRVSQVIKMITQSSWSHSALYIGKVHDIENPALRRNLLSQNPYPPETQLIIEGMLGKGTLINPLSNYKNDHIRICRPRGLSRQDAQKIIGYAISKLGTQYDTRHIFDLARFLLPWSLFPRRMRSSLFSINVGETVKTVCSSMLAEAFNHVEFPILPLVKKHDQTGIELIRRNPKLHTPRDFDYSPYFDIIKYPFIDTEQTAYRQFPWNREGLVSHDDFGITEEPQHSNFSGVTVDAMDDYHERKKNTSKKKKSKSSDDENITRSNN